MLALRGPIARYILHFSFPRSCECNSFVPSVKENSHLRTPFQAIGPILGGALTTGFGWRSIFWFLSIVSGTSWFSFLCFFHETFRKGRSLTYQDALKQRLKGFGEITGSKVTASSLPTPIAVHLTRVDLEEAKAIPPLVIPTADVNLRLKDVNPLKPIWAVLRRVNNLAIFFASGELDELPVHKPAFIGTSPRAHVRPNFFNQLYKRTDA